MKAVWLLVAVSLLPQISQARIIEGVAAIVNDQPLLLTDISRFRQSLSRDGLIDKEFLRLFNRDQIEKNQTATLDFLIADKLISSEVKKRGLEVTFERVEQEIRGILKRGQTTRAEIKQTLEAKGSSFADYQAYIKSSMERQTLLEREISARIKISDEDVAAYYLALRGVNQKQTFEYQLAHILFLPSNGGEAAATDRAQQVIGKLRNGSSFEKMAEQYSEDPNFSNGGLLGTFKSNEMQRELESAVRPLNVGETSGVVKTKMGLHVLKVLKKTITSDPELEEKREEYRSILFAEAFKRQFNIWIQQRRDDSFIRINLANNEPSKK